MIQAIVFSKNRAAQLDLLLRSVELRADDLFDAVDVIYLGTEDAYREGYEICKREHRNVFFMEQEDFQEDTMLLVHDRFDDDDDQVCFLCDDDVMVRPFIDHPPPNRVLDENQKMLCFSLRLGTNTTSCYPLRRTQLTPPWLFATTDIRVWDWTRADGDWGYPGSLDGHLFRRNMLRAFLLGETFTNPNHLEGVLVDYCGSCVDTFPLMACYESSLITGVPINRVNDTHPNRAGETYPVEPELLNAIYLGGKRAALHDIDRIEITAAHTELELVFE